MVSTRKAAPALGEAPVTLPGKQTVMSFIEDKNINIHGADGDVVVIPAPPTNVRLEPTPATRFTCGMAPAPLHNVSVVLFTTTRCYRKTGPTAILVRHVACPTPRLRWGETTLVFFDSQHIVDLVAYCLAFNTLLDVLEWFFRKFILWSHTMRLLGRKFVSEPDPRILND